MKTICVFFFTCVLGLFSLTTAESLTIDQGARIIAAGDGTAYSGTRSIDSSTNRILSESWEPTKPPTNWDFTVYIVASGYGEAVLSLYGKSQDYDIGDWRSGPELTPADKDTFSLTVSTLSPAYNFPMILLDSPPHAPLNSGYANEINTGDFSGEASGTATTRGRKVETYYGSTAGLNVGLNMSGPNVGIVIGGTTNWKWSPGPNHPDTSGSLTASMSVSVSDSGSGSGSGSGSTPTDNTPNCQDCTSHCSSPCNCSNSGTCDGTASTPPSPTYHACDVHETSVSGNHSYGTYKCGSHSGYACQESNDHETYISSCTQTDSNGNTCTNSSGYYECSAHVHSYPPALVACAGAPWTNCSGAPSEWAHYETSCSQCSNGYWTCSEWAYQHTSGQKTCRRPGCRKPFYECQNGTCTSDWGTSSYHWAQ